MEGKEYMFLRYMNIHKAVNLDNFDLIEIDSASLQYDKPYRIVAVKKEQGIRTYSNGFGGSDIHSNGRAEYVIKMFTIENEAISFYEKLQYAWINKLDVFEVI